MSAPAPAILSLLASFTLAGVVGGAGASMVACTGGTTPVCDDAGSCLISQGESDASPAQPETGSTEAGGGDAGGD